MRGVAGPGQQGTDHGAGSLLHSGPRRAHSGPLAVPGHSPVRKGMCPRAGQRGQRWPSPLDFTSPGLALCLRLLH